MSWEKLTVCPVCGSPLKDYPRYLDINGLPFFVQVTLMIKTIGFYGLEDISLTSN